jgi:hypothetical protein
VKRTIGTGKLNGCIWRNFDKNTRKQIQKVWHSIMSKPAMKYGSEAQVLRMQDKKHLKSAHVRLLRPIHGVTLNEIPYSVSSQEPSQMWSSKLKDLGCAHAFPGQERWIRGEDTDTEFEEDRIFEVIKLYQSKWQLRSSTIPPHRFPQQALIYW